MKELQLFEKGFPQAIWMPYYDRKLAMNNILMAFTGREFERMPRGKKTIRRFKLL